MWQAIGSIGSSLLGGLFGMKGASDQNRASAKAAQAQMDFQERMSNTAHQREIKDLEAAGLNPILSAKLGGASSPGGAQPNIVNEMAPMENAARGMSDKLYNFRVQDAQVDNMKLQNDMLKEQIQGQQISNAKAGMLTPAYKTAGEVIEGVTNMGRGIYERLTNPDAPPDVVQEALDAASENNGIRSGPHSAKSWADRFGSEGSEARKWAKGEKSFEQSFRDSMRRGAEKPENLTEEKLRAYGIRRLQELNHRSQSNYKDGFVRLNR